jgi:cellulose synthase (UDP-forming)
MTLIETFWPGLAVIGLAAAILPLVDRDHPAVRAAAVAFCLVLMWRYMAWRLFETIPSIERPLDFAAGSAFALIETLNFLGATATMIFLVRRRDRSGEADRNRAWLESLPRPPLIDVLICTYNEEREVLERTIAAACATDYPDARLWVCDDNNRDWLRRYCQELDIGYLTRLDNLHAKAGNINSALAALASMSRKPDFVAILDADFAPFPQFLSRAAALMREADVGVVQTPQHFFNHDPIQQNLSIAHVWPDEQRFFFDVVLAAKDAWGAAFCCGTSALIRFDALTEINGFPTDSVTEDYLLTLRMKQRGYRTVYLNERLSLGLAPEGLQEYCVQRSRWCLGFMQIFRGPNGPLRRGNGLGWIDRLMLVESFLFWTANPAFRLLALLAPALYLLFGIVTVNARTADAISHVVPFIAALLTFHLWLIEWRVMPFLAELNQLLCATDVLKSAIVGLLGPKTQKFKVTAKGGDRRSRFVQWPLMPLMLVLLSLNVLGVVNAFLLSPRGRLPDSAGITLFWSWYNIFVLILACVACVEQPRFRQAARFATDEIAILICRAGRFSLRAKEISVTGARLAGATPLTMGETARLELEGFSIDAKLARLTEDGFAVAFVATQASHMLTLKHLFSGRYSAAIDVVRPRSVAAAILARILKGAHVEFH